MSHLMRRFLVGCLLIQVRLTCGPLAACLLEGLAKLIEKLPFGVRKFATAAIHMSNTFANI